MCTCVCNDFVCLYLCVRVCACVCVLSKPMGVSEGFRDVHRYLFTFTPSPQSARWAQVGVCVCVCVCVCDMLRGAVCDSRGDMWNC